MLSCRNPQQTLLIGQFSNYTKKSSGFNSYCNRFQERVTAATFKSLVYRFSNQSESSHSKIYKRPTLSGRAIDIAKVPKLFLMEERVSYDNSMLQLDDSISRLIK
jgi:hypothetical protein